MRGMEGETGGMVPPPTSSWPHSRTTLPDDERITQHGPGLYGDTTPHGQEESGGDSLKNIYIYIHIKNNSSLLR